MAQLRIPGKSSDRRGGLLGGSERRHDAARADPSIHVAPPLEQLATGADIGGDHRNARGVGLQDDQRLPFADAREDEDVDLGVDPFDRQRRFETNPAPESEPRHQTPTPASVPWTLVARPATRT